VIYNFIKDIILFLIKIFRYIFISIPRDFNIFSETPYEKFQKDCLKTSYEHFNKYFKSAVFLKEKKIKEYAISHALELNNDGLFIEFGVYKGASANFFSKYLNNKKIYAFDSFEGLKEDWKGTQTIMGTFDLKGKIPKLNPNVIPIKGWIQDTLPSFLDNNKEKKINFIHMDVDTYESSLFILKEIKPNLAKGSIILFDELYNYVNWQENEYKALSEVFKENEYKFIAFSKEGAEVVLKFN
jgi:hypothetical protein